MNRQTCTFSGQSILPDAEGPPEATIVGVWDQVSDVLRDVTIDFGSGGELRVRADWSRRVIAPSRVRLAFEGNRLGRRTQFNFGEVYLSFVFLAVNLSCPGAAQFWDWEIRTRSERHRLRWSSHLFDAVWHEETPSWVAPRVIHFEQVWNWLMHTGVAASQVAHTPTQRAVLSLMNASWTEFYSPTTIVWLSSAIEALYGLPPGGLSSALKRRTAQLFQLDPVGAKKAGRDLGGFYEARSRIVHGSFSVIHPLHNDIVDRSVDDIYDALASLQTLGTAFVVGTLQRMIEQGWLSLEFPERLVGTNASGIRSGLGD